MKRFPSIKKNDDFRTVYTKGRSYANSLLVLYSYNNHTDKSRIGISVSKKIGNSVIRHRLVRIIRECFRLNKDSIAPGHDIVAVLRAPAREARFADICEAFISLCKRHNILI